MTKHVNCHQDQFLTTKYFVSDRIKLHSKKRFSFTFHFRTLLSIGLYFDHPIFFHTLFSESWRLELKGISRHFVHASFLVIPVSMCCIISAVTYLFRNGCSILLTAVSGLLFLPDCMFYALIWLRLILLFPMFQPYLTAPGSTLVLLVSCPPGYITCCFYPSFCFRHPPHICFLS